MINQKFSLSNKSKNKALSFTSCYESSIIMFMSIYNIIDIRDKIIKHYSKYNSRYCVAPILALKSKALIPQSGERK